MQFEEKHPQVQLVDACRRLLRLIDNPNPGLFTWNAAVSDAVKEVRRTVNNLTA